MTTETNKLILQSAIAIFMIVLALSTIGFIEWQCYYEMYARFGEYTLQDWYEINNGYILQILTSATVLAFLFTRRRKLMEWI